MKYRTLTADEERVILHRGTEAPFSGTYLHNDRPGVYLCKRCDAELYRSRDKFDSHCGWPSFDEEIPSAVARRPDPDGRRTEIVCGTCGAHLGHVFSSERMTPKNTRHCVNSISLIFRPDETATAYFAGGCFWGVEYMFQDLPGVIETRVGYMGGDTPAPTYRDVCSGTTGHAEAVEVIYDPEVVGYEDLAKFFFEIHDPTQRDRQGPDIGGQYRSVIFYGDETERAVADRLIRILREGGMSVATEIERAGPFHPAEAYHQSYYRKTGHKPYCHTRTRRF